MTCFVEYVEYVGSVGYVAYVGYVEYVEYGAGAVIWGPEAQALQVHMGPGAHGYGS